jgi:hypothetical protein
MAWRTEFCSFHDLCHRAIPDACDEPSCTDSWSDRMAFHGFVKRKYSSAHCNSIDVVGVSLCHRSAWHYSCGSLTLLGRGSFTPILHGLTAYLGWLRLRPDRAVNPSRSEVSAANPSRRFRVMFWTFSGRMTARADMQDVGCCMRLQPKTCMSNISARVLLACFSPGYLHGYDLRFEDRLRQPLAFTYSYAS